MHWSRTEHAFPSFPWRFTVPSPRRRFRVEYRYLRRIAHMSTSTKALGQPSNHEGYAGLFLGNRWNRSSTAVTKAHGMGHGSTHFLLASPCISCHNLRTARREARWSTTMEGRSTWMFWFLTGTTSNSVGQRAAAARCYQCVGGSRCFWALSPPTRHAFSHAMRAGVVPAKREGVTR